MQSDFRGQTRANLPPSLRGEMSASFLIILSSTEGPTPASCSGVRPSTGPEFISATVDMLTIFIHACSNCF